MMRTLICLFGMLCLITFSCSRTIPVYDKQDTFYLSIHQELVEPELVLTLENGELVLFEIQSPSRIKPRTKVLFSERLVRNDELAIIELSEELFKLENKYEKALLGGVDWKITVYHEERLKEISLSNYQPDETENLIIELNKLLPDGVPKLLVR